MQLTATTLKIYWPLFTIVFMAILSPLKRATIRKGLSARIARNAFTPSPRESDF